MTSTASRFVPSFTRPAEKEIRQFIRELGSVDRLFVMTGAGISTESGNLCFTYTTIFTTKNFHKVVISISYRNKRKAMY